MPKPQKSADPAPPAPRRFVAYLRVSTDRQGRSGLGLDAQREAVQRFVAGAGGQVIAEHVEVESGKNNARPKLAQAMASCRVTGATTKFTIHILAAVAEHEREMISARTKAALAAAKARGKKLGNPNLRPGSAASTAIARAAHVQQARDQAIALLPFFAAARRAGATTLREVAEAMEARGIRTPSGRGRWHAASVLQVERIAAGRAATPLALAA